MRQQNFYKNKNVIITGAASGLGREISKQLNDYGANLVFLVSPTSDTSSIQFAKKIIRCDLSDKNEVLSLTSQNIFEEVDILINCAGVFPIKSLENTSIEEYESIMSINCTTPLILSKACVHFMRKKNNATIINIGSSSSYNGSERSGAYCISKHALLGMSRSLTKEMKKYGIRVLMFSPGSIKTKMGRLDTDQDFETFLDPAEGASYIIFSSTFENEMITNEVRMNRLTTA